MTDQSTQIRISPDITIMVVWKKQSQPKTRLIIDELIEINTHSILAAYEEFVGSKSKEN